MIEICFRVLKSGAAVAAAALVLASFAAHAQERDSSFFGQIFGGSERFGRSEAPAPIATAPAPTAPAPTGPAQMAQASPPDLVLRLDRLENQIRQLTGMVEQLQFRNQQLENQVRRMQEASGVPPQARPQSAQPVPPTIPPGPPAQPQRRSDVFDPNDNPGAPGAPPALGAPGGSRPLLRRSEAFDPGDATN